MDEILRERASGKIKTSSPWLKSKYICVCSEGGREPRARMFNNVVRPRVQRAVIFAEAFANCREFSRGFLIKVVGRMMERRLVRRFSAPTTTTITTR